MGSLQQQQHPTEDAVWGRAVLESLADLSAALDAVQALLVDSHGFRGIWQPIMDCFPQGRPPGKAVKVLLKNGLLFQRMLVSCTPLQPDSSFSCGFHVVRLLAHRWCPHH
jgi:hypothetical protein